MTPYNQGRVFEEELAEEFGLELTPASGSVWYSKLDLKGNRTRWSLKSTIANKFPIRLIDINESLKACFGPGGDGSNPIWAVRTPVGDFIVLRKEEFKELQRGELKLINEPKYRSAERRL